MNSAFRSHSIVLVASAICAAAANYSIDAERN